MGGEKRFADRNEPRDAAVGRRSFLQQVGGLSLVTLLRPGQLAAAEVASDGQHVVVENELLKVSLSESDASLTVVDKRNSAVWRQRATPGFRVAANSAQVAADTITAKVLSPDDVAFDVTLKLATVAPHAFDLAVAVEGRDYSVFPGYPFPFAAPEKGWYFVQNTTGEGMLMPLDHPEAIHKAYGWGGGQPWWGLTDLNVAMRARLNTFRLPDAKDAAEDETIYASPLRIDYSFFDRGGYVGLAKAYRREFLQEHDQMQPLTRRVDKRPAVGHLKDGVYVYFWGENPAEDLQLAMEMKSAGIDRGIAVFYGRHEIDRALCDGIKKLGWIVGSYKMPTANLFQVSKRRHWPAAILKGELNPDWLFKSSHQEFWERVCGAEVVKAWPEKARAMIDEYGLQLFYFDTLVVQMAMCLHPDHPQTIEENQASRREIIRLTRDLGMVVGSGEGNCPTWALPELDFFEGEMSLRTYSDISFSVASGGFASDLGEEYRSHAALVLDETRRIPLYQLAFHDYVVGTWVWRDTNFQSTHYAWKKNLFNILYGSMPMWHINRPLWEKHRIEMLADYHRITPIRRRIGFAEMTNHGWLTPDRSVQYSDWDTGDRVVVNFGDQAFDRSERETLAPRSHALEPTPKS